MKVVRLSALCTGRLYPPPPPGNIPGTHFCQRLSRPQGHSVTVRIMSMKNSDDTIGNRNRGLLACNTVPQPTAPPRAPALLGCPLKIQLEILKNSTYSYSFKRQISHWHTSVHYSPCKTIPSHEFTECARQ
jgi:hypothetical protein